MDDETDLKAGRKISAARAQKMRQARALLDEILAELDSEAAVDTSPIGSELKAGEPLDVEAGEDYAPATVKALGDRTLELRVAWGWDGHKERFTPATDFDTENFPHPPVAYYHGYKADGKPAPRPVYVGRTLARENRADGHYITAKLNGKPEADKVWAAALKGEAYVSPGTIGHLRRREPDGTLTYWPIAEISVWDGAPSRKQAHPNSLAFPVLKALYDEAGIPIPDVLTPPEAAGDAASAEAIDPETAKQAIASVAAALLLARKGHAK